MFYIISVFNMDNDVQRFLAESVINLWFEGDILDNSQDHDLLNNRRVWYSVNYPESVFDNSTKIDNTLNISKKNTFLWAIDNTIASLEKELKRLKLLNDPGREWFCDMIMRHKSFLEQKHEIIKDSTEKEVEADRSDYALEKELRFILQQCGLK